MIFIYYKEISSSNISALEYVSSITTALVGNYCNRKMVGRPLSISNQNKKRIESDVSNTESSKKPQLLAHMLEVVSIRRRCAYCSTKERVKRTSIICSFYCAGLFVKKLFFIVS
jgi:hypothetical protein